MDPRTLEGQACRISATFSTSLNQRKGPKGKEDVAVNLALPLAEGVVADESEDGEE